MKRLLLYNALLLLLSASTMAQGFLEQFPLQQQTKYFNFRYKQSPEKISAVARFADGFLTLVNRDFFKADFEYPILVLVLEDRPAFQQFLHREFHMANPPQFGVYLSAYKLFATYEDSGLGTFAHEIMHPLVERNLTDRPLWAMEGIPTFFEKFYGYWEGEELVLNWGYQNPWRIKALRANLTHLDLKETLGTENPQGQFRESDLRLVSVFLWQQGRFQQLLQLIQKRQKNGYDSYFEAAMEMPLERVIPLWQNYLKQIVANQDNIMHLPASTIVNNESDFKSFVEHNGVSLKAEEEIAVSRRAEIVAPAWTHQVHQTPLQTIKLKDGRTVVGAIKMRIGSDAYIETKDGKEVEINASEITSSESVK
jgi:hypothetical protein